MHICGGGGTLAVGVGWGGGGGGGTLVVGAGGTFRKAANYLSNSLICCHYKYCVAVLSCTYFDKKLLFFWKEIARIKWISIQWGAAAPNPHLIRL